MIALRAGEEVLNEAAIADCKIWKQSSTSAGRLPGAEDILRRRPRTSDCDSFMAGEDVHAHSEKKTSRTNQTELCRQLVPWLAIAFRCR